MTFDDKSAVDKEITSLCDIAREKLKKIDVNAKQQKKEVIKELPKSLEGKIPIDTIAIEIKHQLRGEASERYIDKCLDKKYKQDHRVENAKKQQKNTNESPHVDDKDLAAPIPLESETKQKEEIIVVNSGGQVLYHTDEAEKTPRKMKTMRNLILTKILRFLVVLLWMR